MLSLITSYLLQSKEVSLPLIGSLQIIYLPAKNDVDNSRILPPSEDIIFKKDFHSDSERLIKYIAVKKNVEQREAEELLNNFCKDWKQKIEEGEQLHFDSIGNLYKGDDGSIAFKKEEIFNYLQPINVNNVYLRSEMVGSNAVLPALSEENDILAESVIIEKSNWWLWTLILFAIAFAMIFFYFKNNNIASLGSGNRFKIDSARNTYTIPK